MASKNSPKPIGTLTVFQTREGAIQYGRNGHQVVAAAPLPTMDIAHDAVVVDKGRGLVLWVKWNAKQVEQTENIFV